MEQQLVFFKLAKTSSMSKESPTAGVCDGVLPVVYSPRFTLKPKGRHPPNTHHYFRYEQPYNRIACAGKA
jgi:hypothetical protein